MNTFRDAYLAALAERRRRDLAGLQDFVLECEAGVAASLLEAEAAGVDPLDVASMYDRWRRDLAAAIDQGLDTINDRLRAGGDE